MIKTKTIETVEEYDETGRLVKKTITEKEETDDNPTNYAHTSTPIVPSKIGSYEYPNYPDINITCSNGEQ